ncbi:hypothetical protein ACFO1B_53980 [Dactylosporangium siamense]|uniref:Uncharacterized protein n=1 Tax=Dactylosporangium siamense TaxID=685454 RepID=A0A919PYA6_9ACTN|nr:hypothetical protein [Dactylosporangium siamense]GIG52319.1 hypothetical protein Dsi01nite_103600 [Dactylosporangium siamense]
MAKWAVVVAEERYSQERLYASQFVPDAELPAGDEALLVAALDPPVVFGVARADAEGRLRYTVNLIDAPLPFDAALDPGSHPVDEAAFTAVTSAARTARTGKRTWLVSVDLPIEAASPGEAVREFWAYVRDLGPAELPAYVWPVGDELAMQAFVLGAEANQDPEEE